MLFRSTKCMKCMKDEEKKRLRQLTEGFELGKGRNLEEKKVYGEKKVFGLREKRERSKYLSMK